MSVAIMPGVRAGQSASIGRLVEGYLRSQDTAEFVLPCQLSSREDRVRYGSFIQKAMAAHTQPGTLEQRCETGRQLRGRVLSVLDQLCYRGSGSFPVTRTQWLRLRQLALFCARDQDWAGRPGPVIGARSETLSRFLGVNDLNEAIAPLLKVGLVSLWAPNANGRRSFYVSHATTDGETIHGSGWCLAPLILNLPLLEEILTTEQARLERRQHLIVQSRHNLRLARAALPDLALAPDLFDQLNELGTQLHNAKKGRLSRLEGCSNEISLLLDAIESISLPCREETPLPQSPHPFPAIYSDTNAPDSCTAIQMVPTPGASQSGIANVRQRTRRNPQSPPSVDAIFSMRDIPILFPFASSVLPEVANAPANAVAIFSRLCGIEPALAARAERSLGTIQAIACILIIGHKLDHGQIVSSPRKYLAGMLRRAQDGGLNLDASIRYIRAISLGSNTSRGEVHERSHH